MTTIVFHLYVAGASSNSEQILQLYEAACRQVIKEGQYRIDVIDIQKKPDLAEKHKVLALPTISRVSPAPEKRIIGKISGEQAVTAVRFLTEDLSII